LFEVIGHRESLLYAGVCEGTIASSVSSTHTAYSFSIMMSLVGPVLQDVTSIVAGQRSLVVTTELRHRPLTVDNPLW
jgi:hypothetical protein